MRVLVTTESYLPYVSGVTVSVDALGRGLGRAGHDVLVLAPRPASDEPLPDVGSPGPPPAHAWLASYQPPRPAPPGYRMPWPNPLDPALREARHFAPDVVHAHSPFVTGLMARRVARAAGAPLVFTHHTRFADYSHYLGPLAGPGAHLMDRYLRRFWAGCQAIIAPSSELADQIRARVPSGLRSRVHVVPTGVDVAAVRALAPRDPRPERGWPPDSIVVASLGRLAPEKSPLTVLDAFASAARGVPELRLVVIGSGPMQSEVARRADDAGLGDRVHLTGALPRRDALATLAACDIFAFASRTETQGLVLAEALAAGLPTVAVDGPGVRDSVRDGIDGHVISAEPAAARVSRMADVISRLACDAAARRRLAAGASAGADRFSVERRLAEVESLYRALGG